LALNSVILVEILEGSADSTTSFERAAAGAAAAATGAAAGAAAATGAASFAFLGAAAFLADAASITTFSVFAEVVGAAGAVCLSVLVGLTIFAYTL